MDALDADTQARLSALVRSDRVILFMKGTRAAPRCGFSARVVETLDRYLDAYTTHNILDDAELREQMKQFAGWPTYPQLWVDGELVGGADIIGELDAAGELATTLGAPPPVAPTITLTDRARDRIHQALGDALTPLRLIIDGSFQYQFGATEGPEDDDVEVLANGVHLILDRASARRADGMSLDFADGPRGPALVVDNPNEPARVAPLSVEALAQWRSRGEPHRLIDVRTPQEWAIAHLPGAELLDEALLDALLALPKDTPLAFLCHHGVRSQNAAEHFLSQGFRRVFNVEGGIDAWSLRVDPELPRY